MAVKIDVAAKMIVALEVGFNKKSGGGAGGPRWRWGLRVSYNIHHFRCPYHQRLCSDDLPPSSFMSTAPPPPPSPPPTSSTAINHHHLLRSSVNINIYIRSY
ncbi:unnamed protein product [Lactuca virosa]|uniref:Uncharacterized protein n=1 Tax=Lactuca virosa TaxID=75947 RepID=A0AAU9MAA7_9ASTR|nr:unnamed protein product [Lactuca virosa]